MTAPPCSPDTLTDPCTDCRRHMHKRVGRRGLRGKCDHGHPVHEYGGLCTACSERERRRSAVPDVVVGHPYCRHDEGEPCDCGVALHPRSMSKARHVS